MPSPRARCCYCWPNSSIPRPVFFALGERGKRAEQVADEAVDALLEFLETEGAVEPFLADQLLLPLAFAEGESLLRTSRLTQHILTNAACIRRFVPVEFGIEGILGQPATVRIQGLGRHRH